MRRPYLGSPDNPKTAGVVCYITIIGWLIAYFALYRAHRDEVAGHHTRQALVLHLLSFGLNFLGVLSFWGMFPYILVVAISVLLFIAWLVGVSGAVNGIKRPAPLIGE